MSVKTAAATSVGKGKQRVKGVHSSSSVSMKEIPPSGPPLDLESYLRAIGTPAFGGNVCFTDEWTGEKVSLPRHPPDLATLIP